MVSRRFVVIGVFFDWLRREASRWVVQPDNTNYSVTCAVNQTSAVCSGCYAAHEKQASLGTDHGLLVE